VKVIQRALSILDLFLGEATEFSLDEMVEASGINKPTVRRMVATLKDCGYLRQVSNRGKYSLGIKFLDFTGVSKTTSILIPIANPHLIKLREQVNESVQMAVWDGMKVFLPQAYLAPHPLKVVPIEGIRLPMHATSLGKALIASCSDKDLPKYFSNKLERYTPNTITRFDELKKQLEIIRTEGVAYDDEECYLGVRGVAAVLKNAEDNVVGAVSTFGPSQRLSREKMLDQTPMVKECALAISRELGFKGD
jgi:DNA-binding IclR family transcriptional regulator